MADEEKQESNAEETAKQETQTQTEAVRESAPANSNTSFDSKALVDALNAMPERVANAVKEAVTPVATIATAIDTRISTA